MPTYNKLILNENEYIKEICKKTEEKLTEYLEAKTKPHKLEELSDLLDPRTNKHLSRTRRHNTRRNQQHPQKESRRKRWLLRSSLPNQSNR